MIRVSGAPTFHFVGFESRMSHLRTHAYLLPLHVPVNHEPRLVAIAADESC